MLPSLILPSQLFADRYAGPLPIAKLVKRYGVIINLWWRTLAKWRKLTTGTSVESRTDREPMDSPFEVGWLWHAEREFDSKDRSTRAK
jgi:hypothetical protein